MNLQKIAFNILTLMVGVLIITSCGEDTPAPVTGEALFTYEVDGYKVTFTNTSTVSGTVTYAWDFGDGETSTEKNPVHTYANKGEYTVTLTVTDEQGGTHPVTTKIKVDKSTPVKLDDDSFDDWSTIGEGFTVADDAGSVKSFKYDFDSDNIYFYIKQEKDYTDASIFDMLVDIDPDDTTGYTYGLWTKFGGGELLIENGFSANRENNEEYWLDFATYHPENGTEWDDIWVYDAGNTADAQIDGTYKASGNVVEFEFAISRTKIADLNGVNKIKIVAWTSNQDWDEIGWIPNKGSAENPDVDGILIDMN